VILARVATFPGGLSLPDTLGQEPGGRPCDGDLGWLDRTWQCEQVRTAVQLASPDLARRISQVTAGAAADCRSPEQAGRAELALACYLLRWQRRPVPFGLFAGITAVQPARRAAAWFGPAHQMAARADGTWLAHITRQLERDRGLLARLTVVTNSEGTRRGDRFVIPGRPAQDGRPGQLTETSVRCTGLVSAVLRAAADPVPMPVLTDQAARTVPGAAPEAIEDLMATLVEQGILLTCLAPPATVTGPVSHVAATLREARAADLAGVDATLASLEQVAGGLAAAAAARSPAAAGEQLSSLSEAMTIVAPAAGGPVLAVDTVADARITLPVTVLDEAARAAAAMIRTTPHPFGHRAWMDYHVRFRRAYGPGAVVPVRELAADSGLGLPAGYLGAARQRAAEPLSDRDAALLAMIQRASADGTGEITLTEKAIAALAVAGPAEMIIPDRVEAGFQITSASSADLDSGRFELWISAAPRQCSSMTGRFAHLLPDRARNALAASFQTAPDAGTVIAQLSFPPRRQRNDHVVRVPRLAPAVIHIGEHPGPDAAAEILRIDDLAVTANATQFFLVHLPTGRLVITRVMHALEASAQTPPLARFLAEVSSARHAVYGPFHFGAARTMPHLPRVRYGRTILAPARWVIAASDLPRPGAPLPEWEDALAAWRSLWQAPASLTLTEGELRLPLDLDSPLDRILLRDRLNRAARLELRETPGPATWPASRACEFVLPLTRASAPAARPPHVDEAARPRPWTPPGSGEVIAARLLGNPARYPQILLRYLPAFLDQAGAALLLWWHRRHRDTTRAGSSEYLYLYLRPQPGDGHARVSAALTAFASGLHDQRLLADMDLIAYRAQTGRLGPGPGTAEQVAAADSAAALAQIAMSELAGLPLLAVTAASMTSLAAALAPDPVTGYQWMLTQFPRGGKLDRHLSSAAASLAGPDSALTAYPGGSQVASAWTARHSALARYRQQLPAPRVPASALRSLLHDQFLRTIGTDPGTENTAVSLARSIAAQHLGRHPSP
jgi:thiopeptide-type bacteriocin biosynthesis protein